MWRDGFHTHLCAHWKKGGGITEYYQVSNVACSRSWNHKLLCMKSCRRTAGERQNEKRENSSKSHILEMYQEKVWWYIQILNMMFKFHFIVFWCHDLSYKTYFLIQFTFNKHNNETWLLSSCSFCCCGIFSMTEKKIYGVAMVHTHSSGPSITSLAVLW